MITLVFAALFSVSQLTAGLSSTAPRLLDAQAAELHASAAQAAATDVFPAEFLLGMAYIESRYLPNATSRQIKDEPKRRTGVWNSNEKPPNSIGSYFCGVTQVRALTWERCLELRDVRESYKVAVQELTSWYNTPPCRKKKGDDRIRCTLLGYGGGWNAIKLDVGTYPDRVRAQTARITQAAKKAAGQS